MTTLTPSAKRAPRGESSWSLAGVISRCSHTHRQLLTAAADHAKPITAAIVLVGIVASTFGYLEVARREHASAHTAFELASENRTAAVAREIASNLAALAALRSHLLVQLPKSQREFEEFAQTLRISYPSIRSLEWVPRLIDNERADFERQTRRDVTQGNPLTNLVRSESRREYYPVRFLHPAFRSEQSIGFDLLTCIPCRDAMLSAKSTGSPSGTARLNLLRRSGEDYGTAVFAPVWDGKSVKGFAVVMLQVSELAERGLKQLRPEGIDMRLIDLSASKDKQALYTHWSRIRKPTATPVPLPLHVDATWQFARPLTVAGRKWQIVCTPTPEYLNRAESWFPVGVLAFGLLASFGLSSYFYILVSHMKLSKNLVQSLRFSNNRLTDEVAERHRVQKELAIARDEALEAARLKSQFLANMSHEIRTPMNGVLGMTELVLETTLLPTQREHLQIARDCGESLLQLLNNILDLSKIEAGGIILESISFCPHDVSTSIVRLLSRAASAKKLPVIVRSTRSGMLLGDPSRLRQVLTNLVANAIKFTPEGSVVIEHALKRSGPTLLLRYSVTDSGIGIATRAQADLFKPFNQADASTTRQFGGTGLGLAICKQIVELLGGVIGVDSQPGRGSCFWFEVPVRELTTEDEATPTEPTTKQTGTFDGCRILVAEDNGVNQLVVSAALRRLGCAVEIVSNGKEAVDRFRHSYYDVILMDCQMPGLDGYDAARQIRREEAGVGRVPIIALTAHALSGDRERCLEAGMDDYLTKPLETHKLQAVLREYATPSG